MFNFIDKSETTVEGLTDTVIYVTGTNLQSLEKHTALINAIQAADFECEAEKTCTIYAPYRLKAKKFIIAALGDGTDRQKNENTGGLVFADLLRGHKNPVSLVIDDTISQEAMRDFLMGSHLKCYHFDHYRTTQTESQIVTLGDVTVYCQNSEQLSQQYVEILPIIEGVFMARDLVSEPANLLNPETYAQRCQDLEKIGLEVSVLGEQEMADLGMYSLLGVGQGSPIESKLVVMKWQGKKEDSEFPVSLVGKGVCFDAGGISLKPANGMWDMIFDMGGSAAVVGTMVTLANRQAKVNVVGIIGLVENMPDGNAQRPGDVVKTASGKTVEVLNTDAEGRLVLADALWYSQKFFKPEIIINLATLTGAVIAALGYDYAGLFGNNKDLQNALEKAASITGDKVWTMPLNDTMKMRLKSRVADLANIAATPEAGSSIAAAFLQEFINKETKWAHIDMAGTVWNKEHKSTCPKGGTGWGVRLLNEYVKTFEH
ncbi:MAG: leucyl aminopeptidase [Alphaproteobacteria bacterium]|jgi:leucyl aminopeptidase